MLHLCGDFGSMEIRMHENSDDIDHHLSNQNVDDDEDHESDAESIVPNQIFQRLVRIENLLLIQDKTTEEHDASSQQSVSEGVEAILIIAKDLPREEPKYDVRHSDHEQRLSHCVRHEICDCQNNDVKRWHEKRGVLKQRDGAHYDDHGVNEHTSQIKSVD